MLSSVCYCIGFAALAMAPSSKITFATATPSATVGPIVRNATVPSGIILSPTPTLFIPPTFTPSPPPSATGTPTPARTATPTPMLTATPTATPALPAIVYSLLIATRDDDSLFVVNESPLDFPLGPLRLGDGRGAINGAEWKVDMLASGECVTAWQDSGNPKPPSGVSCRQVGERLTRSRSERFWRTRFNVYYSGELVGTCLPGRCSINITAQ